MAKRTTGITDVKFRRWIASQPCMMCGQCFISQAAHIQKGGMGIKGCDSSCRPLCADTIQGQGCHSKLDQNIIKLPWELRQNIIDSPVYYHWKRGDIARAVYNIVRFKSDLQNYK